ncbi:ATP-dependent Clp protease proteolytic subunit [Leclercia adecarboxylata]|uniref:ClpP-like prohead protease/major capsid protein fusion protein n=1 Tax=Leclercia adecarboxylata TaxID=83655 RepID=UPI002DB767C2|nr:ClpP-like prohead protease/major capsid protein fusion protein [Leclercia adecarboxylata]MEB5748666.1 ATP-dependent Clp protease proteolytic subunit [Leclercia adecarboxylata]
MNHNRRTLLAPQGSSQIQAMNNHWYEIRAASNSGAGEIHIYDQIGGWGISASRFLKEVSEAGLFNASQIDIRIHSPGGSTLDGFAIFNTLKRLSGAINIYVDGIAASMASVIAMLPGATVHIPSNAFIMVHNPWGGAMGEADDLRDYADLLDKNAKNMIDAYEAKTGLGREEIEKMMSEETWMTGAEAVEKGFADVLLPEMAMAACINDNVTKEFSRMPKAAQHYFSPRGAAQPQQQQQPAGTIDLAALAAQMHNQMQARETERRTAVTAVFTAFANHPGVAELQASCLTDQFCDAAGAQQKLLAKLAEDTTPTAGAFGHVYAGNGNLIGDSVRNVIMNRAGFAEKEKDNQLSGMTLMELARASLTHRGIGVSGLDRMGMVGLAFTHSSSDFSYILMDAATKSALAGWDDTEETFDKWTRTGELPDFKTGNRVGLEAFSSLRHVRPGAEYKYATVNDTGAQITLATYGDLFSINRHAIINDDMSFITRIPESMGRAAKATIGDLVYAILTSNPQFQKDSLFSAKRKNLVSGELSVDALAAARSQMRRQESGGRPLNISPAFLLVPTTLEALADQVINSTSVPGTDMNAGIRNPVKGMAEIIAEPRLDKNSEDAWYLAARKGADTIEVAYLDGNAAPTVESTEGFTVDGVTLKVRIDAGVAPMDYRGLMKSTGQE